MSFCRCRPMASILLYLTSGTNFVRWTLSVIWLHVTKESQVGVILSKITSEWINFRKPANVILLQTTTLKTSKGRPYTWRALETTIHWEASLRRHWDKPDIHYTLKPAATMDWDKSDGRYTLRPLSCAHWDEPDKLYTLRSAATIDWDKSDNRYALVSWLVSNLSRVNHRPLYTETSSIYRLRQTKRPLYTEINRNYELRESYLIDVLNPVNRKGLHQGWRRLS